jgi:hypothetical protein
MSVTLRARRSSIRGVWAESDVMNRVARVAKHDTRVPVTLTSLVIRRALNVRTTHPGR